MDIRFVPFIGKKRYEILKKYGIETIDDFLELPAEKIAEFPGFSINIAIKLRKYASEVSKINEVKRYREPISELTFLEFTCPSCGAVVSDAEPVCHKCGRKFLELPEDFQDKIAENHIKLLKNIRDGKLWKERAELLRKAGLDEMAAVCETAKEFYELFGVDPFIKKEEEKRRKVSEGLVNGNGVMLRNKSVASLGISRSKFIYVGVAILIVIPVILLGISIATKGIEIDGYFQDWKNIKGIQVWCSGDIFKTVKFVENRGLYLYINMESTALISPEKYNYVILGIFIDSDCTNSTGYKILNIGADIFVQIFAYNGKISRKYIYTYAGNGVTWEWKMRSSLKVETNGYEMEMYIPGVNKDFLAVAALRNTLNEYHTSIFGTHPAVTAAIYDSGSDFVLYDGDPICKVYLYPSNVDFSYPINFYNVGNASSARISCGYSDKVETFTEKTSLNLSHNTVCEFNYVSSGEKYGTIKIGLKSNLPLFVIDFSRGKYLYNIPQTPAVDGIFGEWIYQYERNDTYLSADIEGVSVKNAANTTYLSVCGKFFRGIFMPVGLLKDSDHDGVPDDVDGKNGRYKYDFNNDGIPDSKSRTEDGLPDVDGDGIADYPYGTDLWLNTTIPSTSDFPAEYRGKRVSLYIGERKENLTGEAHMEILLRKDSSVKKINIIFFNYGIADISTNVFEYSSDARFFEASVKGYYTKVTITVHLLGYFDYAGLEKYIDSWKAAGVGWIEGIVSSSSDTSSPVAAVSMPDGKVYACYRKSTGIIYAGKIIYGYEIKEGIPSGGNYTWNTVAEMDLSSSYISIENISMAANLSSGRLYILYSALDLNSVSGKYSIRYDSWDTQNWNVVSGIVYSDPQNDSRWPSVCFDYTHGASGKIYGVFVRVVDYSSDRDIMFIRGTDKGNNILWDVYPIRGIPGQGNDPWVYTHPDIAIGYSASSSITYIHVAYISSQTATLGNEKGYIYVISSSDLGNTWYTSNQSASATSSSMHPSITATHYSDVVVVAYQYYSTTISSWKIEYGYSTNHGHNFTSGIPLTGGSTYSARSPDLTCDYSDTTNIPTTDGYIHAAFYYYNKDDGTWHIGYKRALTSDIPGNYDGAFASWDDISVSTTYLNSSHYGIVRIAVVSTLYGYKPVLIYEANPDYTTYKIYFATKDIPVREVPYTIHYVVLVVLLCIPIFLKFGRKKLIYSQKSSPIDARSSAGKNSASDI